MNKIQSKVLACFIGFAILSIFNINNSFALEKGGVFVEPMVTWERGTGHIDFPAPINTSDSKIRGFGVGARLGVHIFETIFIAADARYSIPKLKDSTLNQDIKSKSYNIGPTVGVQMPWIVGLRAWAGYILGGVLDPDSDKGVDEKFKSGNGWRIGAGLKFAIASFNIEYQDIKYDETDISQVGIFTPGFTSNNIQLRNKSMILSVSFPFSL
ncbi:MAG: outer membrane beta-barrel protein [Bacteriovorax sp.]|nr:outer membrane beta-barrel protein [Bacteriovorax sp.]